MTLYTYDNDAADKSNCNGNCATNWPPLDRGGLAASTPDRVRGRL